MAARKRSEQDRERDREQGRRLDALTTAAIDEAVERASTVAAAPGGEIALEVAFPTAADAVYARKRVNEALAVRELLDEVDVWVWRSGEAGGRPMSVAGDEHGVEIRLRAVVPGMDRR